jgi:uncharacterized protein YndB with AHSA1/START domain
MSDHGLRLLAQGGSERPGCREYREVVEPERLVFKLSDQAGDELYELVIVVLTDLGEGRTEMLFEQRGHMAAKQYERAGEGWSSFFDRMAEHLADA